MANNYNTVILQGKVASEPAKCVYRPNPAKKGDRTIPLPQENAVRFYLNVPRWRKDDSLPEGGVWIPNHIMVYLFGPAMERALDPVKGIKKDARVLIDAGNLDKIQWKEAGPDGGEVNRSLAIVRTFGFKPGGAENINKVIIMGRLHKDPEVKFFDGGGCNVSMTISTDRPVKVNDQWVSARTWSDIKLVGKRAETAGEYLRAGRDALVEGWLEVETWTPKGTDKKASKTIIKGFDFVFAGGSGGGSAPASGDMPPMPADDPWGDSSYGPPDDYYGEGAGGGGDRRAPDLDDEIPF